MPPRKAMQRQPPGTQQQQQQIRGDSEAFEAHLQYMQNSFSQLHYMMYRLQQAATTTAGDREDDVMMTVPEERTPIDQHLGEMRLTEEEVAEYEEENLHLRPHRQQHEVINPEDKQVMQMLFGKMRSVSEADEEERRHRAAIQDLQRQREYEELRAELARTQRELEEEKLLARRRQELAELQKEQELKSFRTHQNLSSQNNDALVGKMSQEDEEKYFNQLKQKKMTTLAGDQRGKGIEMIKHMVKETPDSIINRRKLTPLPKKKAPSSKQQHKEDEELESVHFKKRAIGNQKDDLKHEREKLKMLEEIEKEQKAGNVLSSVSRFKKQQRDAVLSDNKNRTPNASPKSAPYTLQRQQPGSRKTQTKRLSPEQERESHLKVEQREAQTRLYKLEKEIKDAEQLLLERKNSPTAAARQKKKPSVYQKPIKVFDVDKSIEAIVEHVLVAQRFARYQVSLRMTDSLKPYLRIVDKGLPTLQRHLKVMSATKHVTDTGVAILIQQFLRAKHSKDMSIRRADALKFRSLFLIKHFVCCRRSFFEVRWRLYRPPAVYSMHIVCCVVAFGHKLLRKVRLNFRKNILVQQASLEKKEQLLKESAAQPGAEEPGGLEVSLSQEEVSRVLAKRLRNADGTDPLHRCTPFIQILRQPTCTEVHQAKLVKYLCKQCEPLHNPKALEEFKSISQSPHLLRRIVLIQDRFRFLLHRGRTRLGKSRKSFSPFAGGLMCERCQIVSDIIRQRALNEAQIAVKQGVALQGSTDILLPKYVPKYSFQMLFKSGRCVRMENPIGVRNNMLCRSCHDLLGKYLSYLERATAIIANEKKYWKERQLVQQQGFSSSPVSVRERFASVGSLEKQKVFAARFFYERYSWIKWRARSHVRDRKKIRMQGEDEHYASQCCSCERCQVFLGSALFRNMVKKNAASALRLKITPQMLQSDTEVYLKNILAEDDEPTSFHYRFSENRIPKILSQLHMSTLCTDQFFHIIFLQQRQKQQILFVLQRWRWCVYQGAKRYKAKEEQQGIYSAPLEPIADIDRGVLLDSDRHQNHHRYQHNSFTSTHQQSESILQHTTSHSSPQREKNMEGINDAEGLSPDRNKLAEKRMEQRLEEEEIRKKFKKRLTNFYIDHCPEKLGNVDVLVEQYHGREEELFQKLEAKYAASIPQHAATEEEETHAIDDERFFSEVQLKLQSHLKLFYSRYNPEKVRDVNNLVATYSGMEKEIFERLCTKYNAPLGKWAWGCDPEAAASSTEPATTGPHQQQTKEEEPSTNALQQ